MFLCRYLSLSRFQNHLPLRIRRLLGKNPNPMTHFSTFSENQTKPHEKVSKLDGVEHKTLKLNGINMHVAEKPASGSGTGSGKDPIILFIHGFPELWYTWRHQMVALSSLGYRTIAPDLRGYGDTDAPEKVEDYTYLNVVGDLVALINAVTDGDKAVFVVGHDWGAMLAWQLCQYRPDKVKALVNMSVLFSPRNSQRVPVTTLRHTFGDDYYICRFQKPGEIEAEFKKLGTEKVLKEFLTYKTPGPLHLPKGKCFERLENDACALPPWLTQEDLDYYVTKYDKKGFTGPINYYRNIDRNWELTAPWTGAKIHVPVKFIVGGQDLTYNFPGAKEYINDGGFKRDVPLLDETVVLKGLGHFLHEEDPDVINQHIHNFFHKFL
ncbi:PREDICTED: bifunctional epoxide hydrolase 2-like [Camelina sativa]|uniref:Bifunctional epoxide hydrolase 2-like n=1 Tax=Camelina sativa TaxID=90675 RepID=A0ABM0U2L5_CAMSA|nr:PREDICTED: bifunctional epoxide hydrolase 2-like [Camelina sativa]